MGRILPCLVPILACNLHQEQLHHSSLPLHLINREPSLSPGRGEEESDGVSAPPQLHSPPPCSADCSVLHLCCPSRLLCCGPRRQADSLTGNLGEAAAAAEGGRGGRVCNQWWCNSRKATQVELQQQQLVVQLQQTNTADSGQYTMEIAACSCLLLCSQH